MSLQDLMGGGPKETEEQKKAREQKQRLDEMGMNRAYHDLYSRFCKYKPVAWRIKHYDDPEEERKANERIREEARDSGTGGRIETESDEDLKTPYGIYSHPELKSHNIIYDASGVRFSPSLPPKQKFTMEEYREHVYAGMQAQMDFIKGKLRAPSVEYDMGPGANGIPHDHRYTKELYMEELLLAMRVANEKGLAFKFGPNTKKFIASLPKEQQDIILQKQRDMEVHRMKDKVYLGLRDDGALGKYAANLDDTDKHPQNITNLQNEAGLDTSKEEIEKIEKGLLDNEAIAESGMQGVMDSMYDMLNEPEKLQHMSDFLTLNHDKFFYSKSEKEDFKKRLQGKSDGFAQDPGKAIDGLEHFFSLNKDKQKRVLDKMEASLTKKEELLTQRKQQLVALRDRNPNPPAEADKKKIESQITKVDELLEKVQKQKGVVGKLKESHEELSKPEIYKQKKEQAQARQQNRAQRTM
jgi:hypothetical protein